MMTSADRWKNRRWMAWLAMAAGLGFPLLLLKTDSPQLGAIAIPFYVFVGAVVGAYIGFATQDDIAFRAPNGYGSTRFRAGSRQGLYRREPRPEDVHYPEGDL